MGAEGAGTWLGIPFIIGVLVLVVLALTDRRRAGEERLLGLGHGRIAAGYLGALGVLLLISVWDTRNTQYPAVALLYVAAFGLILILLFTVLGLPLIALLRMFRFASVLGVTITGAVIAIPIGQIIGASLVQSVADGFLLAGGFSLAARLPLVRSTPL